MFIPRVQHSSFETVFRLIVTITHNFLKCDWCIRWSDFFDHSYECRLNWTPLTPIREFKMWYGEAANSTAANSGVMTRVPRVHYGFPTVALLSATGKCLVSRTLHYASISLLFTSHFNAFSLFEQPSSKIKYSIIKIRWKIIVSLSFVQKISTIVIPTVSDSHILN